MLDDGPDRHRAPLLGSGRDRSNHGGRGRVFLGVLVPLLVVYSLTAHWQLPYHIDAMTNSISGWYLGNEGTPLAKRHEVLTEPDRTRNLSWFVASPKGPVSQYPPGAALLAGVIYAVVPGDQLEAGSFQGTNRPHVPPVETSIPPIWPATLSAVVVTALAAAVLALVFLDLGAKPGGAVAGGLAFGLATGAWSVAASASWTHGPAMLAVALALLAAQRDRWGLAGAALGYAILTRPHLGVVAVALGVGVAWNRRTPRIAIAVGATASVGLAALLTYNFLIWERLTVSGGYSGAFRDQFVSSSLSWFLGNVAGSLFDARHGLITWAPFILLLGVGVVIARRRVPDWAKWSAAGGVVYFLIQLRANRFSGGDGHFGYRYPLEMLTACAPALFVGFREWVSQDRMRQALFGLGLAVAFAGQMYGATIGGF